MVPETWVPTSTVPTGLRVPVPETTFSISPRVISANLNSAPSSPSGCSTKAQIPEATRARVKRVKISLFMIYIPMQ